MQRLREMLVRQCLRSESGGPLRGCNPRCRFIRGDNAFWGDENSVASPLRHPSKTNTGFRKPNLLRVEDSGPGAR